MSFELYKVQERIQEGQRLLKETEEKFLSTSVMDITKLRSWFDNYLIELRDKIREFEKEL